MIDKLSPEQIAKFPFYVKKWVTIGLQTHALDKPAIEACFNRIYTAIGRPAPKKFIYVQSPYAGQQLTGELYSIIYGAQEANWLSYYDYFRTECGLVKETESLVGLFELAPLCGWCWVSDDTVVVCENPESISMKDKRLHNETGPAIRYSDGFEVYSLNGVRMKKEYVLTPASELSVQTIMKEQNVDIRRELLRKVGLENFIKQTGAKLVDELTVKYNNKSINYKLLDIDLGDSVTARVLKMDNPSIDAVHVEGVEETCNTVQEALAWRMGLDTYSEPEQLT